MLKKWGLGVPLVVAAFGCSGTAEPSSSEEMGQAGGTTIPMGGQGGADMVPEPAPETCNVGVGPVPICDEPLCVPDTVEIELTDEHAALECTGYGGSQACTGNETYQAFQIETEQGFFYFSFDPRIADEYSAETFERYFQNAWFNIYAPGHAQEYFVQMSTRSRTDPFDVFTFEDGRLVVEMDLTLNAFTRRVESDEEACFSGDIAGECYCEYGVFDTKVTVRIDVTVPHA
jgi:hypothetical protein